jgi:hypothetical protein
MAQRRNYLNLETKQGQNGTWQLQTHYPDMRNVQTNGKNGQQTTTSDTRNQHPLL